MTVEYCRIFLLVFNWLTYFPCWYMTIRLNFALVWLLTAYIYCANYYWNKIRHSLFRKNESTANTVTTERVSNEKKLCKSNKLHTNYKIILIIKKKKFYKVTKQLANNLRRTNTELIQQHRFTWKSQHKIDKRCGYTLYEYTKESIAHTTSTGPTRSENDSCLASGAGYDLVLSLWGPRSINIVLWPAPSLCEPY